MKSEIKFAIAEDQEIVRRGIIEIILGFGGFSLLIEAANGEELYKKLTNATILPDIIVMDISMPVWDGYKTLDAVIKQWPQLKVLVLTMHKHEFAIIKMFKSGASGYLLKNSSPKELHNALHSILEKGLYFSEIASGSLYHRLQYSNIYPSLSEKEVQLLKYCHTNLTYKEIANKMGISDRSVAGYRTSLFEKFGVNTRAGLIVCAIQMGLTPIE
jgi:two-component system invasion response regulator UvrY